MANSIKFINEGFDAKYGNIKPDLCGDSKMLKRESLLKESDGSKGYEWSDWYEPLGGQGVLMKDYSPKDKYDDKIIVTIYAPGNHGFEKFDKYSVEVYDNRTTSIIEDPSNHEFNTEEEAMEWAENYISKNVTESLLKESDDEFDTFGGNREDFLSDLDDIEKALDSVFEELATYKARGMVDDYYYELEKMRKWATKKIITVEGLKKDLNESWDSARAYDISKYCLDKGYDTDQALRVVKHQLKKEGSKLPDNDKEIMRVIYSVYDEIDESISVKTLR